MSETTLEMAIGQLLAVLREACEGPAQQWSYFTDNRPEAGLFGTLASLDAAWRVSAVDGPRWERLQQDLRQRYQELSRTVEAHAAREAEAFGQAVAAVAHIAYHLGAIRQKAIHLRSPQALP
ncbi:MAG: hypothetical protein QN160_06335 [Armatimonadota bacterium]|nr:hypothetical protein [Armatimonadota bacterium]